MPKMHLRQPGSTYSTCGTFTKNKERIKKFKETGNSRHVYENELNKAFFQHDMANGLFKDLTRRTASDKILCDKGFDIANNPKYYEYQRGLASMVYKFFDEKTLSGATTLANEFAVKKEITSNKELAEELHKPIITKFNKRKLHSSFIDNIWGADLAYMQLISRFNKEFRFLLCVVDIYNKYAWVITLKAKKGATVTNAFQKILDESKQKPNEIWSDEGRELEKKCYRKVFDTQ